MTCFTEEIRQMCANASAFISSTPLVQEVSLLLKANHSICAWIPCRLSFSWALLVTWSVFFFFFNLSIGPLHELLNMSFLSSGEIFSHFSPTTVLAMLPSQIFQISHFCFPFPSYLLFRPIASAATIYNSPCCRATNDIYATKSNRLDSLACQYLILSRDTKIENF